MTSNSYVTVLSLSSFRCLCVPAGTAMQAVFFIAAASAFAPARDFPRRSVALRGVRHRALFDELRPLVDRRSRLACLEVVDGAEVGWSNFHVRTLGNFTACARPHRPPDLVSRSGSAYWDDGARLVRCSDHWTGSFGVGAIKECEWHLGAEQRVSPHARAAAACAYADLFVMVPRRVGDRDRADPTPPRVIGFREAVAARGKEGQWARALAPPSRPRRGRTRTDMATGQAGVVKSSPAKAAITRTATTTEN